MADSMSDKNQCDIELNKKGGECVKNKHYDQAIEFYTKAIELAPNNPSYYSNRSLCYQKIEKYGLAIQDATTAIKIDENFTKAYFRRATAYMSICKLKNALDDYKWLFKKFPNEKSVIESFKNCQKLYTEEMFAIAIQCKRKSAFDLLNFENLAISDNNFELRIDQEIDAEYAQKLIKFLKDGNLLPSRELIKILIRSREILLKEKSLVRYIIPENSRLTVCGDVHGQFYDLCHIFEINGLPSIKNAYLFNGDFVDRGAFSVEVMTLLLVFKIWFPYHFLLNRGNHECESMNKMYGFEAEVTRKYSKTVYELFSELFQHLPIAHVINDKVLVMHGGLPSKDGVTLKDIEGIDRFKEPVDGTAMFDLLWTDPTDTPGRSPSFRGTGTIFGPDVTEAFLLNNDLKYIIRSHESQMEGYKISHQSKCYTIFSAPNYCDELGNKAAFIHLKSDLVPSFKQFEASPHPVVKNNASRVNPL